MRPRVIILGMSLFSCLACWERQDIELLPPEIPHYSLSGFTVDIDDTTLVLPQTPLSLTAFTMIYDVTFEPVSIFSDSDGYFQIDIVYPGDYIITAERDGYAVIDQRLSMGHAPRNLRLNLPKPLISKYYYRRPVGENPRFTFAPDGLWILSETTDPSSPRSLITICFCCTTSANSITEIKWIRVPYKLPSALDYATGLLFFYSNRYVANLRPLDQTIWNLVLIDTFVVDAPLEDLTWDDSGFWTTFGSSLQYRGTDLKTVEESWAVDAGWLSALAVEGNNLWAYDGDRDLLLKLDRTGKVLLTRRLINVDTGSWVIVHDMAFSFFGTLWVSEKKSRYLLEFNIGLLDSPPHQ